MPQDETREPERSIGDEELLDQESVEDEDDAFEDADESEDEVDEVDE